MSFLIGRLAVSRVRRVRIISHGYCRMVQPETHHQRRTTSYSEPSVEAHRDSRYGSHEKNSVELDKYRIARAIPRRHKADFLAKTISELDNSKEAVYGTLDAFVAWEEEFPIAVIRKALNILEENQEWHRVVQVIKWMLSKGQGTTLNTYAQFILALDMDERPDEAHEFWTKKLGVDMHSVSWELCRRMIGMYYRNQDFDKLVKLYEELESYNRKPPEKLIVMRVANSYEILGKLEEKERVLKKYKSILTLDGHSRPPKSKKRFK